MKYFLITYKIAYNNGYTTKGDLLTLENVYPNREKLGELIDSKIAFDLKREKGLLNKFNKNYSYIFTIYMIDRLSLDEAMNWNERETINLKENWEYEHGNDNRDT